MSMNDRQRLVFTLFAIAGLAMALFAAANDASAYTIANTRDITIDKTTLDRGFTVRSYDDQFKLPVFPGQYNHPIHVRVDTLLDGTALPEGKKVVSKQYAYGLTTGESGFLKKISVMEIHYESDSLLPKSVYYFDKSRNQWRELPSIDIPEKHMVRAVTIFPYAEVVVLEDVPVDQLTAASAIVMDTDGTILYSKNIDTVRPVASLSKLVTASVFLDNNPGWEKIMTVQASDNVGGASVPFEAGDRVSVRDLFFATLVGSKNNAARILMRSTGMSEEQFVVKMNAKVASWGLVHTRFVEPTGLSSQNVSTAREMVEIARRVFRDFTFLEATTIKWYHLNYWHDDAMKSYLVKNTNKLVTRDLYITGGKTGYTHEAGYNLVTQAKNSSHELLALVLGADSGQNYEEVYLLLKKYL